MRNLLLMLVLLASVITHAQNVAINNDASLPDNSAILDIKSGTKGLLIPRMNTVAIAAIINPAKGLLVLDTAKNQLLVNMGTPALPNWQTIVASSGWGLSGNNGIDSVTNFIGTLNTKPLIMRVNNVRAGYLDTITNNTSFGFRTLDSLTTGAWNTAIGFKALSATTTGTNNLGVGWGALRSNSSGYSNVAIGGSALLNSRNRSNLVAIGDSALFNNGVGAVNDFDGTLNTALGSKTLFANTTGYYNTATGTYALMSNTTGLQNTANGSGALLANGIGIGNTAMGSSAMGQNISGNDNTAVGNFGLSANTIGIRNTSVGASALITNSVGNNNTAIGYRADVSSNNLFNATAIGANAKVASSNSLVLGGTGAAAVNVGIGTTTPIARLHVVDSNVLFTGPLSVPGTTTYSPPASGAGSRMMWYPQKAAFRVGAVSDTEWDKDNIGNYSFASGYNAKASGLVSTAMGQTSTASGSNSIAMGYAAIASGIESTAIGANTNASGLGSTSIGSQTLASGFNSTAMGHLTTASGESSTAMGYETTATGYFSTSMGAQTVAKAYSAVSIGNYNDNTDAPSFFIPANNDRIFQIGNGSSTSARRNALTVLRNGNTGIGTTTPSAQLEVIGPASATPVTLTIGNRNAFGPAAIEFVSDYGLLNVWRPGYIRSNDGGVGGFIGSLEFYTNGAGIANKYGNVKGFEVRNGIAYTATGTVSSFSDARLKNNITAFTDGLNVISKINPVQFYYNADAPFKTDRQQVGIIAQELEKFAPYMIEKNKQNDYDDLRSVNNQAYTFILINAVKEQQQQIEKQQKQIGASEARMKQLQEQQKQIETSNEEVKQLQQQVAELKKLIEQLIKK